MDSRHRILMVGLPSTGKSTFLAALWHVVESEEIADSLQADHLQPDREYVNRIRDAWLACEQVPRTSTENTATMVLREPESDATVEVIFPDLSGETFRAHWSSREWTTEFAEMVSETASIMLFLHPQEVLEPTPIQDAAELVKTLEEQGDAEWTSVQDPAALVEALAEEGDAEPLKADRSPELAEPKPAEPTESEWDIEQAPTQVKNVELLQFLDCHLARRRPLPLAIMISAWDLVEKLDVELVADAITPGSWLAARLPQLDQYVRANPESFKVSIFGVSAQGGDLESPDDVARLKAEVRPSKRIRVIGDNTSSHDVTLPIKWLLR